MINKITTFLFFSIFLSNIFASFESENVMDLGHKEIGLSQPFRLGYKNNIEISAHPLLMFVLPNFSLKKKYENYGFTIKYNFYYPTPLMKILQKKGMFGIFPQAIDVGVIPNIAILNTQVLKSISFDKSLITFKGGLSFCMASEKIDKRLSIDLPLIYPAMSTIFNGYKYSLGADLRYDLNNSISLLADGDIDIIYGQDFFIGNKILFEYQINRNWLALLGTKFTSGNYPFGKQSRLFPLLDIIYSFD